MTATAGSIASVAPRVRIAHEFLDDHSVDEIVIKLRDWNVVDRIKAAGNRSVLIGEGGLEVAGG